MILTLNTYCTYVIQVFSREEILDICNLCHEHDVLMISDDVYEHMVYDNHEMVRVATLPGMWDRTITIGSAGKTFSVTGWKLGWAYGPEHLVKNCQAGMNTYYIYIVQFSRLLPDKDKHCQRRGDFSRSPFFFLNFYRHSFFPRVAYFCPLQGNICT